MTFPMSFLFFQRAASKTDVFFLTPDDKPDKCRNRSGGTTTQHFQDLPRQPRFAWQEDPGLLSSHRVRLLHVYINVYIDISEGDTESD